MFCFLMPFSIGNFPGIIEDARCGKRARKKTYGGDIFSKREEKIAHAGYFSLESYGICILGLKKIWNTGIRVSTQKR